MKTVHQHTTNTKQAKTSTFFSPATIQPKLTIGQPNDKYEQEADAMADKVMRMPQNGIQRACAGCEKEESVQPKLKSNFLSLKRMIQRIGGMEEDKMQMKSQIQRMEGEEEKLQTKPLMMKSEGGGGVATSALTSQLNSSKGGGSPLPASTNNFMSNAFGSDFSNVRVHTGSNAIQMNQGLNARAFTHGSDVYFNKGEYSPSSSEGKQLLGHELTHVVQQGNRTTSKVQRETLSGNDNYGRFRLNDTDCKFLYTQKWFFNFDSTIAPAKRAKLMQNAVDQVERIWSDKYTLNPTALTDLIKCPCPEGASVKVRIIAKEGKKEGDGIIVKVVPKVRANVNPVTGVMKVEEQDFAGNHYSTGHQYTIAHEFGHTIDITDEYNGWSKIFVPKVQGDELAMMHTGNNIRPRHYQYFGDLLSFEKLGCRYSPNGIRQFERENPVLSSSTLSGLTTFQDGLTPSKVDSKFTLGQNYHLRLSNRRLFGVFYPHIGAIKLWNPDTEKQSDFGLTAGIRLGQIAHPLVFDLQAGIATNPLNPSQSVRLPISIQAGLRTSKYQIGLHYTPVIEIFPQRSITHLLGLGVTY